MITSRKLHVSHSHFKLEEDGRFTVQSGDSYTIFSTLSVLFETALYLDGRSFGSFRSKHINEILDFYSECMAEKERYYENLELDLKQA